MSNVISIFDRIKKKMKKNKKLSVEEQLDSWVKLMETQKLKSFFVIGITDTDQVIYNCHPSNDLISAIELSKHDYIAKHFFHNNPSTIVG